MLSLFRFRKKQAEQPTQVSDSKTAKFLAQKILWCQLKFTDYLSAWDGRTTARQKKWAFITFAIIMGSIYLTNLYYGWNKASGETTPLHQQHIDIPRNIALPDTLDQQRLKQLKEWKQRQDSLHVKK